MLTQELVVEIRVMARRGMRIRENFVRDAGQRAILLAGDVADEAHCASLVRRIIDELGHLDILVNNAAFQMSRNSIQEITTEEFDRTFRTNVYAMFWVSKAALPRMNPGASIINTTSIQSSQPSGQLLPYAGDEGGDRELHGRTRTGDGGTRGPRECRRAGTRVDAAHSVDHARRESEGVWEKTPC
jgi:NADP-dependent 3-hydroxy acid dehydrogenase YdfG